MEEYNLKYIKILLITLILILPNLTLSYEEEIGDPGEVWPMETIN